MEYVSGSSGCKTGPLGTMAPYKFVVVFSLYGGRLLLSRHRERTTWETQGGHIEPGETPLGAAKRELWEESGAQRFTIEPLCDYLTRDDTGSASGVVFTAVIDTLGGIPAMSEMAETRAFSALPEDVTYPAITPLLYDYARSAKAIRIEAERTENA